MATTGLQREARRAALSILKADSGLTAIVPAARIYSQRVDAMPQWPFIKQGPTQSLPLKGACVRGATVSFSVHAFAKATAGETAEDLASRIGAAIETALDGKRRAFTGGTLGFTVTEAQLLLDGGEADSFHYFAVVSARVLA